MCTGTKKGHFDRVVVLERDIKESTQDMVYKKNYEEVLKVFKMLRECLYFELKVCSLSLK